MHIVKFSDILSFIFNPDIYLCFKKDTYRFSCAAKTQELFIAEQIHAGTDAGIYKRLHPFM